VEKTLNFSTVGMLPVFVLFLFLAGPLVEVVYDTKYADATPMLQIFSVLALLIPTIAVGSNVLLGLGQARLNSILSLFILMSSLLINMMFIPWLGALGATIAYVLSSLVFAIMITSRLVRFIPLTAREIIERWKDIKVFLLKKLSTSIQ
jgi:O-antigen/teichoic acid export membrane protein